MEGDKINSQYKPSSKRDIKIIDNNGNRISDPTKIANSFINFFINIGTNIDDKIPTSKNNYAD